MNDRTWQMSPGAAAPEGHLAPAPRRRRPWRWLVAAAVIALALAGAALGNHIRQVRELDRDKLHAIIEAAQIPGTTHSKPRCNIQTPRSGCYRLSAFPLDPMRKITDDEIDAFESSLGWQPAGGLIFNRGRLQLDISNHTDVTTDQGPHSQLISIAIRERRTAG